MKRLLCLLVLCLLWTSLAMAQTAVVKRNVNLRSDASSLGLLDEVNADASV